MLKIKTKTQNKLEGRKFGEKIKSLNVKMLWFLLSLDEQVD
jgi:hypothetical protein